MENFTQKHEESLPDIGLSNYVGALAKSYAEAGPLYLAPDPLRREVSARTPSEYLNGTQYAIFLDIASDLELEWDVMFMTTWRTIQNGKI